MRGRKRKDKATEGLTGSRASGWRSRGVKERRMEVKSMWMRRSWRRSMSLQLRRGGALSRP